MWLFFRSLLSECSEARRSVRFVRRHWVDCEADFDSYFDADAIVPRIQNIDLFRKMVEFVTQLRDFKTLAFYLLKIRFCFVR